MFNLTENDKDILINKMHYRSQDIPQIEDALSKTRYEIFGGNAKARKISAEKACSLLERTDFLSGISRSAFHWTATKEYAPGSYILFDSTKYFRN